MGLRFKWTKIGSLQMNRIPPSVECAVGISRDHIFAAVISGLGVLQVRAPRSPLLLCMVCEGPCCLDIAQRKSSFRSHILVILTAACTSPILL